MELLKKTNIFLNGLVLFALLAPYTAHAFSFENVKNIKTEKVLSEETNKDYQLLYFWATWCPDCKEKLRTDLKKYETAMIDFRTVNIEKDVDKIKKFAAEQNVSYPIYYDESKKLQKELSVFSVPTVVLIKKNKLNQEKILQISGKNWDEIDAFIKSNNLK